ncbi:MAG: OmpA family protein [Azonexus sp.]|jgi:outer membrane protein OmpA-like peptidoglycan-associated protein|nr:OmpA family protein [Azonexus sp.]
MTRKTIFNCHSNNKPDRVKTVETWAKSANEVMNIILKLLIASGALLTFVYCFFIINFFPTGLTTGDTLFFLSIAVGFAFIHFIILGYSWLATGWLAHPMRIIVKIKEDWRRFNNHFAINGASWRNITFWKSFLKGFLESIDYGLHGFMSCVALAFLVIIYIKSFFVAIVLACMGILLGWVIDLPKNTKIPNKKKRLAAFILGSTVFLLPAILGREILEGELKVVLGKLGVRHDQGNVWLSEENFALLRAVAEQSHVPLFPCDSDDKMRGKIVSGVDVLWHGIGERSLISLLLPPVVPNRSHSQSQIDSTNNKWTVHIKPKESVRVELKREGMYMIKSDRALQQRCIDLNEDTLFETGKSDLFPGSEKNIEKRIRHMLNKNFHIHRVEVIGHADIQPFSGRHLNNYLLAELRAERVKEAIITTLKLSKDDITVESKGATQPKVQCSEKLSAKMMAECLAPNRRVEVRVEFFAIDI